MVPATEGEPAGKRVGFFLRDQVISMVFRGDGWERLRRPKGGLIGQTMTNEDFQRSDP